MSTAKLAIVRGHIVLAYYNLQGTSMDRAQVSAPPSGPLLASSASAEDRSISSDTLLVVLFISSIWALLQQRDSPRLFESSNSMPQVHSGDVPSSPASSQELFQRLCHASLIWAGVSLEGSLHVGPWSNFSHRASMRATSTLSPQIEHRPTIDCLQQDHRSQR